MFYRPKLVRCRLKTGGKSIEQIKELHKGQGLVYRDFESLQQMYDAFSGLIVELSLWEYDNHENYHLESWKPEDDKKVMMGVYCAEQTHPFPRYKNDFEKFKADWEAKEYECEGASLVFAPEDVEELETICEEVPSS